MDFTKKFKSLVFQQGAATTAQSPETIVVRDLSSEPVVVKEKEQRDDEDTDPQIAREILQGISDEYYKDNFDAATFELGKLPDENDIPKIHSELQYLRKQNHVVSKQMSDLILQNQSSYTKELHRVTDLQANLDFAKNICAEGRGNLSRAKKDFTTASLGILASYRKREQLKVLLRSLRMIKTLQQTDVRLRELLEEEDYPGAIQLILECQKASSTFKHYTCISELSSKLQDTLEMTEEQLDVALSKVCTKFDPVLYEKLQSAYKLLGKSQTAMDQLVMHFAGAIYNKAFNIVLGYVELCSGGSETNFQKQQYPELCKYIVSDSFTPCLIDLCKALWEIIRSYWCVMEWHQANDISPTSTADDETENHSSSTEEAVNRYVHQKLEHGLTRVWQDIQQKVKVFVMSSSDISSFNFDEFIRVLDIVKRLIDIGEEFCGSKSEDLQESVRKQTINYFRNYHRGCMEELRMFLENESWELCPVRANFTILHLQEFSFLHQANSPPRSSPSFSPPVSPMASQSDKLGNKLLEQPGRESFVQKFRKHGNPFEFQQLEEDNEDVLLANEADESAIKIQSDHDSDDSDVAEELKKDFVDEQTGETFHKKYSSSHKQVTVSRDKKTLILTNTTLNVLRLFGKYMHMMNVLRPIAFDVFFYKTQLFDYYMYAVYLFFAQEIGEHSLSNKLRTTLKRIHDNLILDESEIALVDGRLQDKVPAPIPSPLVSRHSSQQLYQLAERIAAAESLVFLAEQFDFLRPHLESLIPGPKRAFLQQFLSQTTSTAVEVRRPIYQAVSSRAIDCDQVVNLMNKVNWDIHEIMSQHSYYVDVLLKELQVFGARLTELSKTTPVPKEANDILWEHSLRLANHTFIEGFSQAKKCTNEGRALMQLDFQQFLSKVERITDLRPIPDRDLVEGYVKAYYLLETALEEWIRLHKEYSPKQLVGLINLTHINKRGRQRLISYVEGEEKLSKR